MAISIHQLSSGSAIADGVIECMFFVQSMLRGFGFASEIFVESPDPQLSTAVRPIGDLLPQPDDILLIHHSGGHEISCSLDRLRCRRVLICHGTAAVPSFAESDLGHNRIVEGSSRLGRFREIVEAAIAISDLDARELRQQGFPDVSVIPLLKDFAALRTARHAKAIYYDHSPVFRILFVGRLISRNCQQELIDLLGQVESIGGLPLQLVLIGKSGNSGAYKRHLDDQIDRPGLRDRIIIRDQVSDAERFGWYRAANAYVSLSAQPGFAAPMVEAMALDLPVLAYASAAVIDTMGDAGITLRDKSPAPICEQLLRLHEDRGFRAEVIRSQRRRVAVFAREQIEAALWQWLNARGANASAVGRRPRAPAGGLPGTHYVIEGPFESSYSLALVNRNVALALSQREGCAAYIEPAEGVEDYVPDQAAVERLPEAIQKLVRPAAVTAERIVTIRNMYPPRPNGMLGDRRLIHLAWEESAIQPALAEMINAHLDGVIVPAEYCKRVIRDSGVRLPIAVVRHGIDHFGIFARPAEDRTKSGEPGSSYPFTFIHISGGSARKGIEELLTAYCAAFSSSDPVLLVIKTYENPDNSIDELLARVASRPFAPAIQIIYEELHSQEIELLYRLADAVVLPTRGEGFNLPAAEAMARGRPVIVTRHSGHMDFCTDRNSLLVDCTYELSTSHLSVPNSVWARPVFGDLVSAMKSVYRDGRGPQSASHERAQQACRDVSGLQWRDVAARIDGFVRHLDRRPVMVRKLRLGWVASDNAGGGIAAYSQQLNKSFDRAVFDVAILADNRAGLAPDPDNMLRPWRNGNDSLAELTDHVLEERYDIAFFQHSFGSFDSDAFAKSLYALHAGGIQTYVTLHSDAAHPATGNISSLREIAPALATCTRIFVQGVEEMNRLKEAGLSANVTLMPYGVLERRARDPVAARQLLGLEGSAPVLGAFGASLPGNEVAELICGFALLLRQYPDAYLIILPSDWPDRISADGHDRNLLLLRQLDLEPRVRLISEVLETEEINLLLDACDMIVRPGGCDAECGAIRQALATGRPVVTTPSATRSTPSNIVYQLPGSTAADIAAGLGSLLADEDLQAEIAQRQREWVQANSLARLAARIGNIMRGCFEEEHAIELRAPPPAMSIPSSGDETVASGGPTDEAWLLNDLAAAEALMRHDKPPPAIAENGARAEDRKKDGGGRIRWFPAVTSDATARGERWFRPFGRRRSMIRSLVLADRARDSREWGSAIHHYRRALDKHADNPPIWVQYGHALKESARLAEAEDAYRRSIALAPQVPDTHLQLGHVLKLQERSVEAAAAYLRALVLDPALDHAARELYGLGWSEERVRRSVQRERLRHVAARQGRAPAPCRFNGGEMGPGVEALLPAGRLRGLLSPNKPSERTPRAAWPSGRFAFVEFVAQWPSIEIFVPAALMQTTYASVNDAGALTADNHPASAFCYGPYLDLPAGNHRVQINGQTGAEIAFAVSLTSHIGAAPTTVFETVISMDEPVSGVIADLEFESGEALHDFEILVHVKRPAVHFSIADIQIVSQQPSPNIPYWP